VSAPAGTPGGIFVSYAREDREAVGRVAEGLRQLGGDVWLDDALSGGQAWWDQILTWVRDCSVLVAFVSPAAARSEACKREREYARALGRHVLPVLLEGTALPADLAAFQYVDYTDATSELRAFRLAGALARLGAAPPLPSPLPEPPEPPVTELMALRQKLQLPSLTPEEQWAVFGPLRAIALDADAELEERDGALDLLRELRGRDDIRRRVEAQIDGTIEEVTQSRPDVLYDGRRAMSRDDFHADWIDDAQGDLTVDQDAAGPCLALRRTNHDGRVAIRLERYVGGGDAANLIRGRPGPGTRRLRVQGEARVVGGGSQTLLVRIKGLGDPAQTYLGERRERLTSDEWHEFDGLFELPADKDCQLRFDDRSVTDPPSTLEIRKLLVSELRD
jgi:hypothetical protein